MTASGQLAPPGYISARLALSRWKRQKWPARTEPMEVISQLWAKVRELRTTEFQGPLHLYELPPGGYSWLLPDTKTIERHGWYRAWRLEDTIDNWVLAIGSLEIAELVDAITPKAVAAKASVASKAIAFVPGDLDGREVGLPAEILADFETMVAMFGGGHVPRRLRDTYGDVSLFLEERSLNAWLAANRMGSGTVHASHMQARRILQEMAYLDAISCAAAQALAIEWGFRGLTDPVEADSGTLPQGLEQIPPPSNKAVGAPPKYSKELYISKAKLIWEHEGKGFDPGDTEFGRLSHFVSKLEEWSITKYGEPETPSRKTLGRYVNEYLDDIGYTGPR